MLYAMVNGAGICYIRGHGIIDRIPIACLGTGGTAGEIDGGRGELSACGGVQARFFCGDGVVCIGGYRGGSDRGRGIHRGQDALGTGDARARWPRHDDACGTGGVETGAAWGFSGGCRWCG